MRRIGRQHRVQDGGSRARRSGHEERRLDRLVAHAGVGAQMGHQLQPHLEQAQQEAPREPAADPGELPVDQRGAVEFDEAAQSRSQLVLNFAADRLCSRS